MVFALLVAAAAVTATSLEDAASLVGTIACDACQQPFQPIGVVRLAGGRLIDVRLGEAIYLPTVRESLTVQRIGNGFILFKGAHGVFKLTSGGFPAERAADSEAQLIAEGLHLPIDSFTGGQPVGE